MGQIVEENPGVVTSSVFGQTFEGRNMTFLKVRYDLHVFLHVFIMVICFSDV